MPGESRGVTNKKGSQWPTVGLGLIGEGFCTEWLGCRFFAGGRFRVSFILKKTIQRIKASFQPVRMKDLIVLHRDGVG